MNLLNILLTVVSLSVSASIMLVIYFALRRILKQYLPASACYALLAVILLRLVIPYAPESALMNALYHEYGQITAASETNSSETVQERRVSENTSAYQAHTGENSHESGKTAINTANETPAPSVIGEPNTVSDKSARGFPWETVLFSLWLMVAVGIFGMNVIAYEIYRRRILAEADYSVVHTNILAEIARGRRYPDVFLSTRADTPMVLGLLNPVIILPYEDDTLAEVEHILRHELCHYRRFDVAFKWLAVAACSLHWFNPLMLLFRREWEDACECSCDAAATRGMNAAERRAYIRTLLKTVARQVNGGIAPLTAMTGSAKRLEERFASITRQKRLTPARAALSLTAIAAAAAIGLSLGACTFPAAQSKKSAAEPVTQDNTVIRYAAYDYGFEGMGFEVTDRDAYYDEQKRAWRLPKENTNYAAKPTRVGGTLQRSALRNVYELLHFEQYERIGEVESFSFFAGDGMYVDFWTDELHYDTLCFYLEKDDGKMFVWLNESDKANLYHPDIYRSYPDYLKSSHTYSVFDVPDDLYGKVASQLYPLAEISAQGDGLAGLMEAFPSEDIGNDEVYAVISGKMRIVSDDFGCDFYASIGDSTYQVIWDLFKGIGQCDEIQPRPDLDKTDEHIIIIGPDDYGEVYVSEYITIYADSGVICVRFKGDEMWYSVPKDLVKTGREIAALQI